MKTKDIAEKYSLNLCEFEDYLGKIGKKKGNRYDGYSLDGNIEEYVEKFKIYSIEEKQRKIEENKRKIEIAKEREELIKKSEAERIKRAKELSNINDIYEYDVVTIRDERHGGTDIKSLKQQLMFHTNDGWRLVNTFTNELGVNSSSIGMGGFSTGTNSTIDETVLIFERCVKRYKDSWAADDDLPEL